MFVINVSHDPVVITDFNGKRFVFRKHEPVEIAPELYSDIVLSKHINANEIVPYEKPVENEQPENVPVNTVSEQNTQKVKNKVNSKGKKKR